jgi:hypothetical protein
MVATGNEAKQSKQDPGDPKYTANYPQDFHSGLAGNEHLHYRLSYRRYLCAVIRATFMSFSAATEFSASHNAIFGVSIQF